MKKKIVNGLHSAYRFSNTWTGTIIIVLFVIFFVAQAFRIPSGSMKDSLLVGDHLFAKKFAYGISTPHIPFLEIPLIPGTDGHIIDGDEPKRGDIVIFRYPNNTQLHYVKRCVALPGDELFLMNKILYIHPREGDDYAREMFKGYELVEVEGKLWVKNPYAKEHHGIHNDEKITDNGIFPMELFNFGPIQVPEKQYFMMGDNRDHSNDSRFWGAVPYGLIEGTPWFVYFSMDADYKVRWDRIGKTPYDLEQPEPLSRAVAERIREDANDHELY
ncbi:MAG: signal peptidase I [Sulfuricurvum sp.]|uniref:signal peptidase I n=1 Tax=Sulfuricurvum sp. TaxID=2025608 RepID=UPI00260DAA12|nr:signal peptidase I [Sulfuricurvum sp.]MDD2838906.1 signal peptidase I [Sulfuricurvum sp.]MDD4883812.1 signal peptidase I [Sulfuricurvum sp.]